MNKPTRRELVKALTVLLQWATQGDRHGNPYCTPEVKQALKMLAREQGRKDRLDVDLNSED